MKLIIEIFEDIYEIVMNTVTFGCYRFNTSKAIKNGTPLDDLKVEIEREKLESKETEFCGDSCERFYNKGLSKALKIIDKYIGELKD